MAKKKVTVKQQDDIKEMFDAMREIEKTKGVPFEVLLNNIKSSIEKACGSEEVVYETDPERNIFRVFVMKTVVENVTNPDREIDEIGAREIDPRIGIGEKVKIEIDPKKLGRKSVQNARSVIRQGIRDKEREITLEEFRGKDQEIVSALVENIDPETGNATVKIGRSIATLTVKEQVGLPNLKEGDSVRVYLMVREDKDDEHQNDGQKKKGKGPKAIITRTRDEFVKRLFELEVPEIHDGTVEIKAVSREAGLRTKIAVCSKDPNVDSVGSCIGARGSRVAKIVDELGGEKIDIIEYKDNMAEFIAAALAPANVVSVEPDSEDGKEWKVVVPDGQLSLAIGNRGQNARLAAHLTGCKIDIRPESGLYGGEDQQDDDMLASDDVPQDGEVMIDASESDMADILNGTVVSDAAAYETTSEGSEESAE